MAMLRLNKLDKNSLIYLSVVFVIAVLVGVGFFYYSSKTELKYQPEEKLVGKPMKEIIKSLTAPGEGEPVSKEVKEDISASSEEGKSSKASENTLQSLTAPE